MEHPAEHQGPPRPTPRPKPPVIPGYELEGVLGRGSTGVVYKGRQLAVDREVAVKVLHADRAKKRRVVQRLQREARTTARLAHPHIVSAIDMGEVDGVWWYAMEFVEGPTLAERLAREGRLGEREALRLFIPLCEALVHAWEHGVVHRDIKPANILIDRARGACLADLGLAFVDDDPSLTGSEGTLGTPHYMSPEQARSPADADVRSDIWSFGATLFHAVCGRTPFTGESLAEVLSGVLYARVPDPARLEPRLSKGLALVLRKCLSRKANARYQTPGELLADLERLRERRQPRISRRQLDPVDRGRRPVPAFFVLGLLGLLAGATLATAVWWGDRGTAAGEDTATRPFAPLESLAGRIEVSGEQETELYPLMTALLELEPDVPAAWRARWIELRTELRARLRGAVGGVLRRVGDRTDELVRAEDYRGALEVLDSEFDRELFTRTGYTLETLPDDQLAVARARLRFLRSSVEAGAAAAASGLRRVLERHLEDVLFPKVAALREAHRWRSARAELDVDDEDLLRRATFAGARFPAALVEEQLDAIRVALFARRAELDADWGRLDQDLRRWVARRADRIEEELREGEMVAGGARELERAFERELLARGLVEAELHPAGLPFARGELEARAQAIDVLEDTLRERRAREEFQVLRDLSRPLWGLREYEALRDRFEGFAVSVRELPGDAGAPWRADLLARTARVRREAELLAGLLDRAARAVVALDGRSVRLRLGSITVAGTVDAGVDPLDEGFSFTPRSGSPQRISLRTINPAELERLAGLRADGELTADPADRLLAALFRFREGEHAGAEAVLSRGPLPAEGRDADLASSLAERVAGALQDRETERARRGDRARFLLEAVKSERYDRATVLGFVDQLLGDFDDVPEVRAERDRLRRLRDDLRDAPSPATLADVARAYGLAHDGPGTASSVSRAGRDRARLRFDFSRDPGTWEIGGWIDAEEGWTSPPAERFEDLARSGPRLPLKPPLEPTGGELELVLRIEQPEDAGPPKCTVVSLAGYHFALVGAALSPDGPRWLVGSRGLDALLERIEAGEGERAPALLHRGQTHELRFVVRHATGSVELRLDGRTIHSGALSPPQVREPEVAVRALERIRLLSAELAADMR